MGLADLVGRPAAKPWDEGARLPWHDPEFSTRMLREHLSQDHDHASRRAERIEEHVRWLQAELLRARRSRVLDLGCGPGLYCALLAKLGHRCLGIDFSPASVTHARATAERERLSCEYELRDLRDGGYGTAFRLALLIHGELNTFTREEAATVVSEARQALTPGGALVLEVHDDSHVRTLGRRPPTWQAVERGLFSDEPHLILHEPSWHEGQRATVEQYFVIDAASGEVARYATTTRAYSDAEYSELLREAGFGEPERHESLDGSIGDGPGDGLFVLVARRRET